MECMRAVSTSREKRRQAKPEVRRNRPSLNQLFWRSPIKYSYFSIKWWKITLPVQRWSLYLQTCQSISSLKVPLLNISSQKWSFFCDFCIFYSVHHMYLQEMETVLHSQVSSYNKLHLFGWSNLNASLCWALIVIELVFLCTLSVRVITNPVIMHH